MDLYLRRPNPDLVSVATFAPPDLAMRVIKPCHYEHLSANMRVTPAFVAHHEEIPWKYGHLSANPHFIDMIDNHPDEYDWCWRVVAYNPAVTPEFVQRHAYRTSRRVWENGKNGRGGIKSEYKEWTMEQIATQYMCDRENFQAYRFSLNKNLTPQFIMNTPDAEWSWCQLMRNPVMYVPFELF